MRKSAKAVGDELENPVATIFRRLGYRVQQKVPVGGREIDIYAEKDTEDGISVRYAVDCKNYYKKIGVHSLNNSKRACVFRKWLKMVLILFPKFGSVLRAWI